MIVSILRIVPVAHRQVLQQCRAITAQGIRDKHLERDVRQRSRLAASLLPRWRDPSETCKETAVVVRSISECARRRDAEGAMDLLRQVQHPPIEVHNAVLNACAKACDFELAWGVWQSMPEKDLVSYNSMISVCSSTFQSERAEEVWEELLRQGLQPNIITYTSMITIHGLRGNVDKATEMFESLKTNAVADAYAYGAIMSAVARIGDYTKTRELFIEMVNAGVSVKHYHFNSLLVACAKGCDSNTAGSIYQMMSSYGVKPTVTEYTSLIACYRLDVVRCREVLKEMRDVTVQPSLLTYKQLVDAELGAGNEDEAKKFLIEAKGRNPRLTAHLSRLALQLGVP